MDMCMGLCFPIINVRRWDTVVNPTHSFFAIIVELSMCIRMASFSPKIASVRICQDDRFLCCK